MDRREALKRLGVAGTVAGLAGCVGVQEQDDPTEGGGGSGGGSDGSDGSDDSDSTTTSGPAGEAKVWYTLAQAERPAREDAIEEFNDESRHTISGSNISDMVKKTTSAIPAGQGPETFDWAHDKVGDYSQRGFLTDRSDELNVELDQFTDAAADAVQYKGDVVGLPHGAETVGLVYNTDIVDEAPETVDDMVAVMEDYHDPENGKYGLGYPINSYSVSAWLQAFGGYFLDLDADPQLGVAEDETVKGLEFLVNNFKPYMPKDFSYGPQATAFADGNAAFAINGPWYLSTLNDKGVNYEVAKLPKPEGGSPRPFTGISMWYFTKGMDEDTPAATAGQDFVEWYVTDEELALQLANDKGLIPVLDNLVGSDELPDSVQAFSQAVGQGIPMPSDPKMAKIWPSMKTAIIESFNGNTEPESALQTAAEEIRDNWD
jgi:arabinogalactan oligomer/maltooligosaccharide transport system substrate-binding protein